MENKLYYEVTGILVCKYLIQINLLEIEENPKLVIEGLEFDFLEIKKNPTSHFLKVIYDVIPIIDFGIFYKDLCIIYFDATSRDLDEDLNLYKLFN